MIYVLQSLASAKSDKSLLFIKILIDQRGSAFIYTLLPIINKQKSTPDRKFADWK